MSSGSSFGSPAVCSRTSTPVRAPKRFSCVSRAGTSPWSSSADGRSWRASVSSSSIAWLTSRLSSATSPARSAGASWDSASSRSRIAVRAWFTSSCRSRARRRRSSSCARIASAPERRRSSSMRSSRRRKECVRRSISSTGSGSPSENVAGSAGSIVSIRSIRCSSGRKRRCSIQRLTQSVSMIESARIKNDQRWSATVRSSPAARLAAKSVIATSTTFAATTWPMRESSRRIILGLCMDRKTPTWDKWGHHPISAGGGNDETPGEA